MSSLSLADTPQARASANLTSLESYVVAITDTPAIRPVSVVDLGNRRRFAFVILIAAVLGGWRVIAHTPRWAHHVQRVVRLGSMQRVKPELQSSFWIVIVLWTDFTCSVARAMDTALSAASWVLVWPVSHTTPSLSVST
jgi:hypothetical protein